MPGIRTLRRDMARQCGGLRALLFAMATLMSASQALAIEMQKIRSGDGPVRVLTFNVLGSNKDFGRFSTYLAEVDPDIVLLQEANRLWLVSTPLKLYPFRRVEGQFVIASRLKFASTESVPSPEMAIAGRSFLRLQVEMASEGRTHLVSVYDFHPTSPRLENGESRRADDYESMAGALAKEPPGRGVIVGGDYNAGPDSLVLKELLDGTGLKLADAGTLETPTRFAREFSLPSWLGFAIDHVAVRSPLEILSRKVGPDIGSDHLPVVVDLVLRPGAS